MRKSILSNIVIIFFFLILSSCSNSDGENLLNSIKEIAGTKFESDWRNFQMYGHYSYCKSGGVGGITPDRDGAASFNFNDDELEVHYSGSTRMEELQGNISYETEKYGLSDFEQTEYFDENLNFKSKKINAKWDNNKTFTCYLKKYLKGTEKPSLNPKKVILDQDIYVVRFEVNWGNNAFAFLETTELEKDKQKQLYDLLVIKSEKADENTTHESKNKIMPQGSNDFKDETQSIPVDTVTPTDNSSMSNTARDSYYHIQDVDGYTNLRDCEDCEIIRKVYPDEKFIIIGSSKKYYIVQFDDGSTGYLHKSRVVKFSN